MPEVFLVDIHIEPPSPRCPGGRNAEAYFTFVDDVVTVADKNGQHVRDDHGKLYSRNEEPPHNTHATPSLTPADFSGILFRYAWQLPAAWLLWWWCQLLGAAQLPEIGGHMRRFISWCSIHTDAGSGSYAVIDDTLTVRCANGTKSVQLGGISPATHGADITARISKRAARRRRLNQRN